jgi:hypothetical protein
MMLSDLIARVELSNSGGITPFGQWRYPFDPFISPSSSGNIPQRQLATNQIGEGAMFTRVEELDGEPPFNPQFGFVEVSAIDRSTQCQMDQVPPQIEEEIRNTAVGMIREYGCEAFKISVARAKAAARTNAVHSERSWRRVAKEILSLRLALGPGLYFDVAV